MIIQPIEETSVVATAVESAVVKALITKDVDAVIVPTDRMPNAAAPVDPGDILVSMMIELAVTAVVETVAVPATKVTLPKELAPAVVDDATLEEMILLPAVPKTKLPLVAVIAPSVAVTVVPAVTEVPAETEPAEAAMLPRVAVMFPAETTAFPVVTVRPVPAVSVVVVVKEPGVVIALGKLNVIVLPEPVDVIWLAVPNRFMFPAVGLSAPPDPPVKVTIAPVVPEPNEIQLPEPGHINAVEADVFNHKVPFT
jgi:hypothetical protein